MASPFLSTLGSAAMRKRGFGKPLWPAKNLRDLVTAHSHYAGYSADLSSSPLKLIPLGALPLLYFNSNPRSQVPEVLAGVCC